jgi:hypothetical protein
MHWFNLKARNSRNFDERFNSAYLQHIAGIEGKDSKDKLVDSFIALRVN